MMVYLVAANVAIGWAVWLRGLSGQWNFLWYVVLVGSFRLFFDARIGFFAFACAVVSHGTLATLLALGIVETNPLEPTLSSSIGGGSVVMSGIGRTAILCATWLLASYVAFRIRSTEDAFRRLNAGLEERVREQVSLLERAGRLRRYLAPQVVERIIGSPDDPGAVRERRHVTVMFADLRGFTAMVERIEPDALVAVLNHYFEEVTQIAFRHRGTVDKFIGDAVMVFFGAPEPMDERDQALHCVQMALEIQKRVAELADEFVRRSVGEPLSVRIGIASGVAVVGAVGALHRADFTVLGSPVNRAARLEPLARPGGVLIDEGTRALLGDAATCTHAGDTQLKGFANAIATYHVEALESSAVRPVTALRRDSDAFGAPSSHS
jgi:class 3 adenylate cyclase